jgi:hypothetical protein
MKKKTKISDSLLSLIAPVNSDKIFNFLSPQTNIQQTALISPSESISTVQLHYSLVHIINIKLTKRHHFHHLLTILPLLVPNNLLVFSSYYNNTNNNFIHLVFSFFLKPFVAFWLSA